MTGVQMPVEMAKELRGTGVEFGAGTNPFPVPAHCNIIYADRNSSEELAARDYFAGQGTVPSHIQTDIAEMEGIAESSVDFIIGSHVIEHTPNPIKALRNAYRNLRTGGRLLLVVPDKNVTFDKGRGLTSLDHLIADYEMPSRERDFEHYVEFFRLGFPQPDPIASARMIWERGDDVHFHTWTYESFGELIA